MHPKHVELSVKRVSEIGFRVLPEHGLVVCGEKNKKRSCKVFFYLNVTSYQTSLSSSIDTDQIVHNNFFGESTLLSDTGLCFT